MPKTKDTRILRGEGVGVKHWREQLPCPSHDKGGRGEGGGLVTGKPRFQTQLTNLTLKCASLVFLDPPTNGYR
jgi:hypothetical protein